MSFMLCTKVICGPVGHLMKTLELLQGQIRHLTEDLVLNNARLGD